MERMDREQDRVDIKEGAGHEEASSLMPPRLPICAVRWAATLLYLTVLEVPGEMISSTLNRVSTTRIWMPWAVSSREMNTQTWAPRKDGPEKQ